MSLITDSQITEDGPTTTPTQKRFYASEQHNQARAALDRLKESPAYNTETAADEPSFVDRHLLYLSKHPLVKLEGYISNLRLMIRGK